MAQFTVLGDGTLTLGDTPDDFSGEVLGGQVTHDYEDVGDERIMLDGTIRPAGTRRTDGFTANVENDLTAGGLYKFLMDNDGDPVAFSFVPNTADGAEWNGTVIASLPSSVGSDEYGSPIVSDIELRGVGAFVFTPAT